MCATCSAGDGDVQRVVACATRRTHCGDIASGKFAIQDALCVSWRENLNWREINEALYLVNGFNPMNAAPQLNLDDLGLDANQLRALQDSIAASRSAAIVLAAPPPPVWPRCCPSSTSCSRPRANPRGRRCSCSSPCTPWSSATTAAGSWSPQRCKNSAPGIGRPTGGSEAEGRWWRRRRR